MIIGIDASRALRARRTGTERYSLEIIRHLLALPEAQEHNFRLYLPDRGNADYTDFADLRRGNPCSLSSVYTTDSQIGPEVELRYLPGRRVWSHTALAWEVIRHRPDVLFVPSHVIPFAPPRLLPPSVVTLHDIGYRHFPGAHTASQRLYLELSTRWSSFAAQKVIAPSQATAEDLAHFYGTAEAKIRVIYEAATALTFREAATELRSTGSDSGRFPEGNLKYALYVGTLQPRKNLARLLDAYALLVRREAIDWDLVIAGGLGWLGEPFPRQAERLGLADRVHFPGYVADGALPGLFEKARFFAFPSLYEGFGLPVLEAQQMGVAVMTSNNSSLPEVAGDAALLVDPNDTEAIADAMLRLSRDESLRQELIAKGYENVKRFSWEKAARETLAVLLAAAGRR
ncbi:MAG: glycosyltransferase family 4 protein [Caldilineaceae bacterium]|nr:glycosyltransferase family 4 protein [Caldilineaceae bacterium]HRJ41062.1 glycosyltransferase family 1 protein [Caldilineaceae bacterium]